MTAGSHIKLRAEVLRFRRGSPPARSRPGSPESIIVRLLTLQRFILRLLNSGRFRTSRTA